MRQRSLQPPMVLSDENGNSLLLLTSANQQLNTVWLRASDIESFYDRIHLGSSSSCSVVFMKSGVQYDVQEPAAVIASMIFQEEIEDVNITNLRALKGEN